MQLLKIISTSKILKKLNVKLLVTQKLKNAIKRFLDNYLMNSQIHKFLKCKSSKIKLTIFSTLARKLKYAINNFLNKLKS